MRFLTAIPVFNEERHLDAVLHEVHRYSPNLLIVNDGSTDRTGELLARHVEAAAPGAGGDAEPSFQVVTHPQNRGYGAALISAFQCFLRADFDVLITMDCDGQHEPARIPVLLEALDDDTDIVSGSRYLRDFRQQSLPTPADRREINQIITSELNERFGLNLTDAFCGFKAYRRRAVERLCITETGWGMPLQLWVQAAWHDMTVKEVAVPRLYLDPTRAFGGVLNDAQQRLAYYRGVIDTAWAEVSACSRKRCLA